MRKKAIWTQAFPEKAAKLRLENSRAGGIKSRSQSEKVRMEIYKPIAAMFKRLNPKCEICLREKISDVHHKLGRSGLLLFDVRHWMGLCRACHQWIAQYPEAARKAGWLAPKGKWNNHG